MYLSSHDRTDIMNFYSSLYAKTNTTEIYCKWSNFHFEDCTTFNGKVFIQTDRCWTKCLTLFGVIRSSKLLNDTQYYANYSTAPWGTLIENHRLALDKLELSKRHVSHDQKVYSIIRRFSWMMRTISRIITNVKQKQQWTLWPGNSQQWNHLLSKLKQRCQHRYFKFIICLSLRDQHGTPFLISWSN